MANDLVLNSEATPGAKQIEAALALIPDDVSIPLVEPEIGAAAAVAPVPFPTMEPWATVNVDWVVPLAGKLVQLPYEQAAKVTGDDCWLVTDDQIELINPALENAIKWVVWRLGAANTVSHPLVAFGVAMGSLTAVKYGVYQFNQHQRAEGGPAKTQPQQQRPRPTATPPPTNMDSSTASGRTAGSEGESYSAGSQGAAKATLPLKEFVVVDE